MSDSVRLVSDGVAPYVIKTSEAIKLASDAGKDLILINESQNPPIAKIEDYTKFLYNQEKLLKEKKKNSIKNELKEMHLSQDIAINDLQTKARKCKEFLSSGSSIKCVIALKGRQKMNPERSELVMLKFADMLMELGVPDNMPKLDGSRWIMTIRPKK